MQVRHTASIVSCIFVPTGGRIGMRKINATAVIAAGIDRSGRHHRRG